MSTLSSNENGNKDGSHCSPINQHGTENNGSKISNFLLEKKNPPTIAELAKDCFAPGIESHFEHKTNLPLLKSTNLAILNKQQSTNKEKIATPAHSSDLNGVSERIRCSSVGPDFYDRSDLHIVRACWEVILSFMGDENEALEKGQCTVLFESTIDQRRKTLASKKKEWRKSRNGDDVMKNTTNNKRPASMFVASDHNANTGPQKIHPDHLHLSDESLTNMTVLEKVRFLADVGLKQPCFRDEIYCQIMKQLVGNPSVRSNTLGWILFSVIVGCFSPSEKILAYVEAFLKHWQTAYSGYCLEKLTRTLLNGSRKNPPCSLELQAAKARQQIRLPVICMDYSVRTIWTDSATTAEEICSKMASKNRLGDSFGFSLYLSLDKKEEGSLLVIHPSYKRALMTNTLKNFPIMFKQLVSLGSGSFCIMDAISQAERYSKLNDVHEVWKIYYRREFFTLLDAMGAEDNQMKTWLTYSQICGGVQSGEYQCKKPQDLALLMAHQYCVRHGLDKVSMKRVVAVCDQNLPVALYNEGKKKKWCRMVYTTLKALEAKTRHGGKVESLDIMCQVVRYGSKAFIDNFTKSFFLSSYQEVSESGPCTIDTMMKINHSCIVVCRNGAVLRMSEHDTNENVLVEINVSDLKEIEVNKSSGDESVEIRIKLVDKKIYAVRSPQANEIARILKRYMSDMTSKRASKSSG